MFANHSWGKRIGMFVGILMLWPLATGLAAVDPVNKNLFGTAERDLERGGVWRTDFTRIKAGSLLKADGGFLVLDALDALTEPGVWTMLKRVLRNREIDEHDAARQHLPSQRHV